MSKAPTKRDPIDTGGSFALAAGSLPLATLESLVAAASTEIVESDPVAKLPPRVIKLTTDGLGEGIKTLGARCVQPAQPANWDGGTQVPHVPGQKGGSTTPAAPYGAYPAPELGLGGKKKK
jgi:hypothetical protein